MVVRAIGGTVLHQSTTIDLLSRTGILEEVSLEEEEEEEVQDQASFSRRRGEDWVSLELENLGWEEDRVRRPQTEEEESDQIERSNEGIQMELSFRILSRSEVVEEASLRTFILISNTTPPLPHANLPEQSSLRTDLRWRYRSRIRSEEEEEVKEETDIQARPSLSTLPRPQLRGGLPYLRR